MTDGVDSAAARTLIDDVQRLGADSADLVAERFSALMASYLEGPQSTAGPALLVSAITDVIGEVTDAAVGAIEAALGGLGRTSPTDQDEMRLHSSGRVAEGEFWLHNTTAAVVDVVTPRVTSLVGGAMSLDAAAVTITPPAATNIAPGSSVRFGVSVDTADMPSGRYRGLIAAAELPGPALCVIVEVAS